MIQRTNQNSIIVLATLGVYLGLVLAGATPQVLAHAAMTKEFGVRDEIEVNDDLDTKPERALGFDSTDEATARVVAKAIDCFLTQFAAVTTIESVPFSDSYSDGAPSVVRTYNPVYFPKVEHLISIRNFPRAGLA